MRQHTLILVVALLLALPARAEEITLSVHGNTPAGTLPTFFEPSAFFGWTSNQMKLDFAVDAGVSHGLVVESTQLLLGPSTSLANYQARLAQSGLATVAALTANAGGQFLLQVHGMPRWISSSSVINTPPGCEEEWPTYQTVAPDPAKWADWEAAIAATVTYFNVTHGLTNVWYQFWEEPDAPCFWTDTQANFLETWRHFVAGARSADPAARVGGPEPAGGPDSIKPGTSWAIMQSFIEFSAAQGIQPDFISYHLFGSAPEQNRRANQRVLDLLSANGFPPLRVDRFVRPMRIVGDRGVVLDDVWATGPCAYMTIAVPDFPNFYMLNGPNGRVGNFSLIEVAELQVAYALQMIERVRSSACGAMSPSRPALARFDAERRAAAVTTIWNTGCKSWYLDASGLPTAWPFTFDRFRAEMSQPRFEDWVVHDGVVGTST